MYHLILAFSNKPARFLEMCSRPFKLMVSLIGLTSIFNSCNTNEIEFVDLATVTLSKTTWQSNGSDLVTLTIEFTDEAVIDKIKAKAKLTNGTFVDSGNSEISFSPSLTPEKKIISVLDLKSSTNNTDSHIEININEFRMDTIIEATPSVPEFIEVTASSFFIENQFSDEITVTANLRNNNGQFVSQGVKVLLEDIFENGEFVEGRFRQEALISDSSSKISAIYSVGNVQANQDIYIRATVLDENGGLTQLKDSVQIFINQKQ